ncbi:acyl transferase family protein [Streptomyces sp. Amel2xB2]|uniref:ACP S-malonyltransferase n=1 Tax=Streptomyces sp. Amel2xB2 TaxID=1305829 RepID=UPI000DBA1017|nr:acyltransferase domain-containing protein [Streptomyces sp. Amel2xB2]RAJ62419.1 acyl transferase family protein [Streptomyces sp. Amel2xB2]
MSIAFLFPGRGSQRPGMLHRLPDTAASATVLAEADIALRQLASRTGGGGGGGDGSGREYADGIAELDSAQALELSSVASHLALLIAGVAGARALIEDEGVQPAYVAGHDTGGYAAAVLAGVLTLEEALRAVRLRGELLDGAGSTDETENDVAIRLAQHLATVKRRPQSVPYVGGLQGRSLRGETNAVFDDLAWSVARPVQWAQVTARLAEADVTCCVELPPGRTLTAQLAEEQGASGMRAVSVEEYGIAAAADVARERDAGAGGGGGGGVVWPSPAAGGAEDVGAEYGDAAYGDAEYGGTGAPDGAGPYGAADGAGPEAYELGPPAPAPAPPPDTPGTDGAESSWLGGGAAPARGGPGPGAPPPRLGSFGPPDPGYGGPAFPAPPVVDRPGDGQLPAHGGE